MGRGSDDNCTGKWFWNRALSNRKINQNDLQKFFSANAATGEAKFPSMRDGHHMHGIECETPRSDDPTGWENGWMKRGGCGKRFLWGFRKKTAGRQIDSHNKARDGSKETLLHKGNYDHGSGLKAIEMEKNGATHYHGLLPDKMPPARFIQDHARRQSHKRLEARSPAGAKKKKKKRAVPTNYRSLPEGLLYLRPIIFRTTCTEKASEPPG